MMKKPGSRLGLSLASLLLSSLLYLTVPPASASAGVDWLHPWAKRAKITVNSTNINAALTNFPVLIHLSTNCGENAEDVSFVFDELGSDANRKKIAVTTSDGTNQCYVEIEDWIHASEQAWLWARVPNIASNADTDLYIYYDNGRPDNTNYVGAPNSTPAENVWDSNYKLVTHMQDDPDISHIRDSTTNDKDGTKTGTNQPIETTSGEIDGAQDFDGDDDFAYMTMVMDGDRTIEWWMKPTYASTNATGRGWFEWNTDATNLIRIYHMSAGDQFYIYIVAGGVAEDLNPHPSWSADEWMHGVVVIDETTDNLRLYINGALKGTAPAHTGTMTSNGGQFRIGTMMPNYHDGIIDEVRISDRARSLAWIKACYETQRDRLLDFGIEENRPLPGTVFSVE